MTWSLPTNGSGATVDGGTYTAGPTGGVTDVVLETDASGNRASATVQVTAGVSVSPSTANGERRARRYPELLASAVDAPAMFRVISSKDIATLIGLEGQRQPHAELATPPHAKTSASSTRLHHRSSSTADQSRGRVEISGS